MRASGVIITALLIGLSFFPVWNGAIAQAIIFVDQSASGANDGSSWSGAFIFLQDALAAAQTGDELWVAQGVYRPDHGVNVVLGNREASFVMSTGVSVYGGFEGTETNRNDRNWEENLTILSGDLLNNDTENANPLGPEKTDNSFHVVYVNVSVLEDKPTLDGFVISSGIATESPMNYGGGLLIDIGSHAKLGNLVFRNNFACISGGAMHSYGTFTLSYSRFRDNSAGPGISGCDLGFGGGLFQQPESRSDEELDTARIEDVFFESNIAGAGGAITVRNGPILVTNTTFLNTEAKDGGAVHNLIVPSTSPAVYLNNRFISNKAIADTGGAMSVDHSAVIVANSLFVGNTVEPSFGTPAGGALSVYGGAASTLSIVNSTVAFNSAPITGALWISTTGGVEIWNTLIWGNTGGDGLAIRNKSQVPVPIGNSIVQGGLPTGFEDVGGNMASDPLFVDPVGVDGVPGTQDDDFSLTPTSPAIDAGSNSALPLDNFDLDADGDFVELLPVDLAGNDRVLNGGTAEVVDIGALEFDALAEGIDTIISEYESREDYCSRFVVFPNPSFKTVRVIAPAQRPDTVELTIYDVLGRLIKRNVHAESNVANERRYTVDLRAFAPGLYILRTTNFSREVSCSRALVIAN